MIVEHEVIEQVELQEHGRPLVWVCHLVRKMGRDDPITMLQQMWRAGYLAVVDSSGKQLRTWHCERLWRERDETAEAHVVATDLGSRWVHVQ